MPNRRVVGGNPSIPVISINWEVKTWIAAPEVNPKN